MAKLVSKVYGDALFETALERDQVDVLYEEVSSLIPILEGNPELMALLNNPRVVKEEKVSIIHRPGDGGADGLSDDCGGKGQAE